MLSHSCARHYQDIPRNVPDAVLDKIGRSKGKVDGIVMVKCASAHRCTSFRLTECLSFLPYFATPDPSQADVNTIADHVTYIADRIGKHQ